MKNNNKRLILVVTLLILVIALISLIFISKDKTQIDTIETTAPAGEYMVGIYGHSIELTNDGGFIVAGYIKYQSKEFRDQDLWVMKAKSNGKEEWQRTFGGFSTDRAFSIRQISDGNYIVLGESYSFGNDYQILLMKLNKKGQDIWHSNYGGSGTERSYEMILNTNSDIMIAGNSKQKGNSKENIYLLKTDSEGKILLEKTISDETSNRVFSITELLNGTYATLGTSKNPNTGATNILLNHFNQIGELKYKKVFSSNLSNIGKSIISCSDGGYAFTGTVYDENTHKSNVAVYKYSEENILEWSVSYGGNRPDGGEKLIQTTDGGFAIVGYTQSYGAGYKDVWLLKLNSSGQLEWQKTFGGKTTDWGYDLRQTEDFGFLISGMSKSTAHNATDVWVIRVNKDGEKLWDKVY